MTASISAGSFMVDETDSTGRRIWAMNVTDLAHALSPQIVSGMSSVDALTEFLSGQHLTVTADELTPLLPAIESAIDTTVFATRSQAIDRARRIIQEAS